jgi:hypothetical protein
MCQLSILRTDRTRRSTWPNAPVSGNGRIENRTVLSDRTHNESDQEWPNASGRVRTFLYFDRTYWRVRSVMTGRVRSVKYLSGTWPDALQTRPIDFLTASDHNTYPLWLWSTQSPRPVHGRTASGRSHWDCSDCQHWPDASGQGRDRVWSRIKGSNDFKLRRNLNRVSFNWTLGFTWAT